MYKFFFFKWTFDNYLIYWRYYQGQFHNFRSLKKIWGGLKRNILLFWFGFLLKEFKAHYFGFSIHIHLTKEKKKKILNKRKEKRWSIFRTWTREKMNSIPLFIFIFIFTFSLQKIIDPRVIFSNSISTFHNYTPRHRSAWFFEIQFQPSITIKSTILITQTKHIHKPRHRSACRKNSK